MRRFVVIATTRRGVVEPPEPLDAAGQWKANEEAERCDAADRERLRQRATFGYQRERDPLPEPAEVCRLRMPVRDERVDMLVKLATLGRKVASGGRA